MIKIHKYLKYNYVKTILGIDLLTNYIEEAVKPYRKIDEKREQIDILKDINKNNKYFYKIYMWLAALHGAQCTLRNNCNETIITNYIQKAKSFNKNGKADGFLTYLDTKFECLVSLLTIDFFTRSLFRFFRVKI